MGFNISSFISFSRITLGEGLTRPLSSLLQSQVLHLKLNLHCLSAVLQGQANFDSML